MVVDVIVNGLAASGTYALLAVGFALIFSVARILNMAHTAFFMIAAFLFYIAMSFFKLGYVASSAVALVLTVLLGIICYKLFFERVKEHEQTVMIISVALAMVAQEVFSLLFGGSYRGVDPIISGFCELGETRISYQHVFAIACTGVILIAVWVWLSNTRIGNAIRAVAQDAEMANVMGINDRYMCVIVMTLSVFLAAVAGVLMAPIGMVHPHMWTQPIVVVLAAVILGGLGSIGGSLVGAVILGYVETIVAFLVPGGAFLGPSVALMIMVLVLMIRPEGLFGVFFEEERL
ncbi:MAG: branched-chain amino acid ABC transporter permease [Smithellaceae bacterium]|nr:branched-chain amino acid ABC transporter permease [Smithellaceae bacterium]